MKKEEKKKELKVDTDMLNCKSIHNIIKQNMNHLSLNTSILKRKVKDFTNGQVTIYPSIKQVHKSTFITPLNNLTPMNRPDIRKLSILSPLSKYSDLETIHSINANNIIKAKNNITFQSALRLELCNKSNEPVVKESFTLTSKNEDSAVNLRSAVTNLTSNKFYSNKQIYSPKMIKISALYPKQS